MLRAECTRAIYWSCNMACVVSWQVWIHWLQRLGYLCRQQPPVLDAVYLHHCTTLNENGRGYVRRNGESIWAINHKSYTTKKTHIYLIFSNMNLDFFLMDLQLTASQVKVIPRLTSFGCHCSWWLLHTKKLRALRIVPLETWNCIREMGICL